MSIRLLIGRSGSGKTFQCLKEITEQCAQDPLGPPLIMLVPEQASYQTEKSLLESGAVNGYSRAQVLSFTRLSEFVFSHDPGPELPRLSANHRLLITTLMVARRRREGTEPFYQAPGIEEALFDLLSETKQYAASPERLREAINLLEEKLTGKSQVLSSQLHHKLNSISDLCAEYNNVIADKFEDPQDTLVGLHDRIITGSLFQGAQIYIDGFMSLTPVEEKILVALALKSQRLTISLLGDPKRWKMIAHGTRVPKHPVFTPMEEIIGRLQTVLTQNGAKFEETEYIDLDPENCRFKSQDLAFMEQYFFQRGKTTWEKLPTAVSFHELSSPREESRLAVELLAQWIRDHQWKYSEVGILTRDLDLYAPSLEEALRTLRLPYFIDRSQPLDTHPLVLGIQSLIRAVINPSRLNYLIELGKSGFLPVPRHHVDFLEMHQRQYPRSMKEWYSTSPWKMHPSRSPFEDDATKEKQEALPSDIEETRLYISGIVSDFRKQIKETTTNGNVNTGVYLETLASCIDAQIQQLNLSEDDLKILERIGELLGEVREVTENQELEPELITDLVIRSLGQLALPRIPPMLNEVFVGQADRSRQPPIKGVVVLGLAEGSFPRVMTNSSLLNDTEREMLEEVGVDLRLSSRRQFDRETLFAYRALTAASDKIAFLRPKATESGSPATASLYWTELRNRFPAVEPSEVPERYTPGRSWRARELAASALRLLDKTHEIQNKAKTDSASHALAAVKNSTLLEEVKSVKKAAHWANCASLHKDVVTETLKKKLYASATQLESFSKCPFQHYVRYFLRPSEIMEPEFERRDAGLFAHAILHNFTMLLRDQNLLGQNIDEPDLMALYNEAATQPRKRMEANGFYETGTGTLILERLDEILWEMAQWLHASFLDLPFHPSCEEASIRNHEQAEFLPLTITDFPSDWNYSIRGQIDRVDLNGGGDAVVVDYKLHQKSFDFNRWLGEENLQLPIYLLTLENQDPPISVAGGVYLEIISKKTVEELEKSRDYRGIFRSSVVRRSIDPNPNWRKLPFIQGSNGDPDEKPRTWGTPISDQEFDKLLEQSMTFLKSIGEKIVSGDVSISPSRFGNQTACTYCSYRPVCQLDYRLNRPRLKLMRKRADILQTLREEQV